MPPSIEQPCSSLPDTVVTVTPDLLRAWPLPSAGDSKYGRGQIVVIGGAARSPGAAMLAGLAALRVGAGRLTLAVAESVAPAVGAAIMEAGVIPLGETSDGHVRGSSVERAASDLSAADAVLVGPGLEDAAETENLLSALVPLLGADTAVVLDAYALGVLPRLPDVVDALRGRLVLTPNKGEASRLLGSTDGVGEDVDVTEIARIARTYGAVVSCYGTIADAQGTVWSMGTGTNGLGTSGSGDVLAGAIVGLIGRGAKLDQAAVWATHLHASAGDRLAVTVGPLGYLASELLGELPRVLVSIGA